MSEHQILDVDPWLKEGAAARSFPPESVFLCAYLVNVGIDAVEEAAFIRRTASKDELWLAIEPDHEVLDQLSGGSTPVEIDRSHALRLGCAVVARRASDTVSAARILLDALFRSRVGFGWPCEFVVGGLIGEDAYRELVKSIKDELDGNAREAEREESEIVAAARELGLHPEPTGTGPDHWRARCPETNHGLGIRSELNQFWCGYCRRKGGPEELGTFVEEREAQRRARATSPAR